MDWISIVKNKKKNKSERKIHNSNQINPSNIVLDNETNINYLFDLYFYDDILYDFIDIKINNEINYTNLFGNLSLYDIIHFFYRYIDKDLSVNSIKDKLINSDNSDSENDEYIEY